MILYFVLSKYFRKNSEICVHQGYKNKLGTFVIFLSSEIQCIQQTCHKPQMFYFMDIFHCKRIIWYEKTECYSDFTSSKTIKVSILNQKNSVE